MAWSGIGHGFANSHRIPSWISILHELSKEGFSSTMIRDLDDGETDPWLDTIQPKPPQLIGDGLLGIHGVLLDTVSEVDFPFHEEPNSQDRFARVRIELTTRYNGRRYKT